MSRAYIWRCPMVAMVTWCLAAPPVAIASTGPTEALMKAVQPGDVLTITPHSGPRKRGELIALTSSGLELRSDGKRFEMPIDDVKTVRRHARRKVNPGAKVFLDTANTCSEIDCSPGAFAFLGIAAAVHGIDNLTHPPKIVYRAPKKR